MAFSDEFKELYEEYEGNYNDEYNTKLSEIFNRHDNETIDKVQESLIHECVAKSDCLIVGRCADYILKDYERRFNVMIYAPLEERIKNSVNTLRIPEYEVADYVKEIDKARDSYHKFFTDEKLDTLKYRDLLIDSSTMSQDDIADIIIESAQRKLKF